ncbi:serine/threonine-protein phosphatase 6 regulatory ankyrin repeat subunit C-like isoform X2 [Octopus vulgaris]|uniref:Serine/threonine-protein phosphatase 6 regulatory ankyrin repeat subunit C-like isoform X2 n=1 Tax=Octopus vulgaris TaxID=6645 RepID=A0AA36MFK4_OCTVU|nr:serine/threonine-protein phosphatase 6 regulatory ankyrin repeat subunit C-like isoform X2 [Octopus vulgaris]
MREMKKRKERERKREQRINKPIDGLGRTPLMIACEVGADRRIIDILIKAGPELGAKDRWGGCTALHYAVSRNHLQAVELLLSRGSNVNEKTIHGNTPLHLAARSSPEWTDGVKAIMKEEAVEVNPRDEDGQTPLHFACWLGYLHTVDLLLGHNGIDANVVNNNGDTPLHKAVRRRNYKVVCAMLKQIISQIVEPQQNLASSSNILHLITLWRELGIESVQLEIIRYDYPYNTVEQSFQMLRRWFTRCDPEKRTHKTLREALEKGRELGIKQVDLNIIKSDFPNDTAEQSFQMLYKWFQCCDPANRTLKTLTEALEEIECFDALEHLSLDTN